MAKVNQSVPHPGTGASSHLQLADPGAVPVGKARPLDKELPLWVALEGGVDQRVVRLAVRPGRHLGWQWRLAPRPVQDLLDFAFERRALRVANTGGVLDMEGNRQEQQVRDGGKATTTHG